MCVLDVPIKMDVCEHADITGRGVLLCKFPYSPPRGMIFRFALSKSHAWWKSMVANRPWVVQLARVVLSYCTGAGF